MFRAFDPQPKTDELPTVFPTPFRPGPPHPLAERAAREMMAFLDAHPFVEPDMFAGPYGGKMMGVLVLRDADRRIGYLRAFAGRLGGGRRNRWVVEGFVEPAFDPAEFDRLWGTGGAEISSLDQEIAALRALPEPSADARHRLDLAVRTQKELSRSLYAELHEGYRLCNARGETKALRTLFEPRMPPGGAGDCAAPKLLAGAYAMGAQPLALAEFWWGGPPPAGGRQHGVFYPACRGRCAKILPFMLEGIDCEPAPDVGIKRVPDDAPAVVHEDEWIVVVDKPAGLLSVPGRGPRRQDSVETRLQARRGSCGPSSYGPWPRLAHRLDLATSGLLIAAKNRDILVALQRQFSSRTVEKRYVGIVAGRIAEDEGLIDLPLGPDQDDGPRQIHDPVRGKPSLTQWRVLERSERTTRVALIAKTGRTHQLRLHTAHDKGLGAPIVGDWLYGFGGERLMLHAQSLRLAHPHTGLPIEFHSDCPF